MNKVLLYDDVCPACKTYSEWLVKWGLLNANRRLGLGSEEGMKYEPYIDVERARHEIPLVDTTNGGVLYGTDAIVDLLETRYPLLGKLYRFRPFNLIVKKIYKLISFNRQVVAPNNFCGTKNCAPDFNWTYRLLFILLGIGMATGVTWMFGDYVGDFIHQIQGGKKMLLIAGTGWVVQMLLALVFFPRQEKRLEAIVNYIGNLAVIMIIGVSVLLVPIAFTELTGWFHWTLALVAVGISSGLMLRSHYKRMKVLGLKQLWTILWLAALWTTALFWGCKFT